MAKRKKKDTETTSEINLNKNSLSEIAETQENVSEAKTLNLPADAVPPTVLVTEDEVKTEVLEVEETAKLDNVKPLSKSAASTGGGMSALSKALVVGLVALLGSVGLLVWKGKIGSQGEGLTKLSKQDMEIIFKDAPPQALKRLAEDPELKKKQVDEIKQFLAVAQEARTTGFADKAEVKKDLEEIRMTITAVTYNKEKNKDKENLPPFSDITKESVDAFFQTAGNQEKFDKLVKEQIDAAKKDGKLPENFEPPAAQLEQYKQQFAKVRLAAEEAKSNWSGLSEEFKSRAELQIKLQQAQYLEQKYSEDVIAKKVAATDEEVKKYLVDNADADPKGEIRKYIDDHPPLTKEQKKAKAEDLMKRAKAGEDFAKLAEEFSDDPGSKKTGGLYKDVTSGKMMPEFEKAALALETGQITDSLVETQYGYHIIKLDRKGTTKGADGKDAPTYDARHILISTMPDDAQSPAAPIKQKIEAEKQKKIVDEIVARHPIEIEDFEIKVPPMPEGQNIPGMPNGMPQGQNGQQPQLSPEQMEQLQKQLKQMQEQQKNAPKPTGKDAPKPTGKDGK